MAGICHYPVPVLRENSLKQYRVIDEYMDEVGSSMDVIPWTLEDLGRLTRLAFDIRSDIGHLESLVRGVDELIMEAVDQDRKRSMQAVA
jgi:hypothetical protein